MTEVKCDGCGEMIEFSCENPEKMMKKMLLHSPFIPKEEDDEDAYADFQSWDDND